MADWVRGSGESSLDTGAHAAATPPLAALHREHFATLVRLAVTLVGNRVVAEDVVQDVFLRLHRNRHRMHISGEPLFYLRASVLNEARNALRSQKTAENHAANNESQPEHSLEAISLLRASRTRVRDAVALLPTRQREVIVMRYLEGLSVSETAQILNLTEPAVRSSIYRAKAALRELLGDSDDRGR